MWKEIKWFRDVATYDALSHDHDHSFSFLSLFLELTRQSPHSQLYRYLHNLCLFWARMCTSLFFCISEWISWEMMVFVVMYFLIKWSHSTKRKSYALLFRSVVVDFFFFFFFFLSFGNVFSWLFFTKNFLLFFFLRFGKNLMEKNTFELFLFLFCLFWYS